MSAESNEIEVLSSKLHEIYMIESKRQADLGIGPLRHDWDYYKLRDSTKEYDRVLARYILSREKEVLDAKDAEKEAEVSNERELWREGFIGKIHCGFNDTVLHFKIRSEESKILGCGNLLKFKNVYQCFECDTYFCKDCIKKHCEKASTASNKIICELDAEISRLKTENERLKDPTISRTLPNGTSESHPTSRVLQIQAMEVASLTSKLELAKEALTSLISLGCLDYLLDPNDRAKVSSAKQALLEIEREGT